MTTADRIRAMLVRDFKIDADKLTPEALLEDLGVDSIGVAELIFNVEDEFNLKLPDIPAHLSTFGDVIDYIDSAVAEQGAATGLPQAADRTLPTP